MKWGYWYVNVMSLLQLLILKSKVNYNSNHDSVFMIKISFYKNKLAYVKKPCKNPVSFIITPLFFNEFRISFAKKIKNFPFLFVMFFDLEGKGELVLKSNAKEVTRNFLTRFFMCLFCSWSNHFASRHVIMGTITENEGIGKFIYMGQRAHQLYVSL